MRVETVPMLTKKALRSACLARRKQMSGNVVAVEALRRWFIRLLDEVNPQRIGLYWPFRSEPDLIEVVRTWCRTTGGVLYIPETRSDGMVYRRWDEGAPLVPDLVGIPSSQGPEAEAPLDLIAAPCVGYSESCRRLGYGGGYFDRYLAAVTVRPVVVGVAYEALLVPEEIFEEHDEVLDVVVTEVGVLRPKTAQQPL